MLLKVFEKTIGFLFDKIIGKLPEDKKEEYKKRLRSLLMDAIKAGAEGTARGVTKSAKEKFN